jgi:hypothetical protein
MERHPDEAERAIPRREVDAQAENQIMLAEYAALRAEIERRAQVQWSVFALQVTAAGAIASLAIASVPRFALLLIIPLSSYMLGSRYILHDFHIKLIQRYIRESLSPRLLDRLQWEGWKKDHFEDIKDRSWFRVIGWNMSHPTRIAFEGVAVLALVTVALLASYRWWTQRPSWLLMLGFALLWILGAALTYVLDRSFYRASRAEPPPGLDSGPGIPTGER